MKGIRLPYLYTVARKGMPSGIPLRAIPMCLALIALIVLDDVGEASAALPQPAEKTVYPDSVLSQEYDSAAWLLPELEITGGDEGALTRRADGSVHVKSSKSLRLGRSFGEADLIASLKSLAGIARGSDYSSGLSVNGASPSQTQYLIDGVPVIFPYRFGGIFSTFNTPHFSGLTFSRQSAAAYPEHLGGTVVVESATRFRSGVEGTVNAGIISSSATIRGGLSDKFSLSLSGRISYIDQIYGRWLKSSRSDLGFSFADINASAAWRISDKDILKGVFLYSSDHVSYEDMKYTMATRLDWKNLSGGLSFLHSGSQSWNAEIWYAGFDGRLDLGMPQFSLLAPSSISNVGGRVAVSGKPEQRFLSSWEGGIRFEAGRAVPQWAMLEMSGLLPDFENRKSEKLPQSLGTFSAFGRLAGWILPEILKYDLSISAGLFRSSRKNISGAYTAALLSPSLRLNWFCGENQLTAILGRYVQPVHRVGFSELGLASDFNIGASSDAPIEKAVTIDAEWERPLPWLGLYAGAAAYFSSLSDATEYRGQVLEAVDADYDPFRHLIVSDGYNVGASLFVRRKIGLVTGEINYGYGYGSRHLPGDKSGRWRSPQSAGHSVKANLVWNPKPHWIFGLDYIFASGRPYTPVSALYMIAGNIAMEYGRRNSARLPYYMRLDLSASYSFTSGSAHHPLRHLINLSLLNATGHRNVEMQYFVLDIENASYELKRLYSLYRFIPSLSYTLEFGN